MTKTVRGEISLFIPAAAHIVLLSLFLPLPDRLDKPHTSFPPNIRACAMSKWIPKKDHHPESREKQPRVDFQTLTVQTLGESCGGRDVDWPAEQSSRGVGGGWGGEGKVMHISRIVLFLWKGGERGNPVRQMEFLILRDDPLENIHFRASSALFTFYIYPGVLWTDCEPAPRLSWFWLVRGDVSTSCIRH